MPYKEKNSCISLLFEYFIDTNAKRQIVGWCESKQKCRTSPNTYFLFKFFQVKVAKQLVYFKQSCNHMNGTE